MFSGKRRPQGKASDAVAKAVAGISTHNQSHSGKSNNLDDFLGASESGAAPLPKEVVEVMDSIRVNWDFMATEHFNPVPQALALLDSGSNGLDMNKFNNMYTKLEKVMDLIVNDYHQAFNDAIQTFSTVVENIADSQKKVNEVHQNLENSKDLLQCKRFDLLHLWVKHIQYKEMNRILDIIDELRKVPDKIDNLVSGKFYLTAARCLISSLKTLHSNEFENIGALDTIRQNLNDFKNNFHEILIDELHNHLYLKSPFSLERIGKDYNDRVAGIDGQEPPQKKDKKKPSEEDLVIIEDLEVNPELDSYKYTVNILEALFILGKLKDAMDVIRERLPVELYYVVERTIQEVDQSHDKHIRIENRPKSNHHLVDLIGITDHIEDAHLLKLMLSSLYEKLECIVVGHDMILKFFHGKKSIKNESIYSLTEVWASVQNEVKTLLYDHLTSADRVSTFGSSILSMNEILKDKKARTKERSQKQLFRILSSQNNQDSESIKHYMQLDGVLDIQHSLTTHMAVTGDESSLSTGVIDKYATVVAAGHRLLVPPDSYNVLITYNPTISFSDKVETMINKRTGSFNIFLEDFILNVFIPQMEDRVLEYFHGFANGPDAFVPELSIGVAPYPIVKSATALTGLIQAMCRTLFAIPTHQLELVKMVEMILVKFYDKVMMRFKGLMSGDSSGQEYEGVGIISAGWACEDEIVQLLLQNTYFKAGIPNPDVNRALSEKETYVEMRLKKERSFHRNELIFEPRTLQGVATMYYSLEWFISQISQLRVAEKAIRKIPPLLPPLSSDVEHSSESISDYKKLSEDSLPGLPLESEDDVLLPLNNEMTTRFDSILNYYQEISETYLFALRVELRCHSMYYLDLAMREGNYLLENEGFEPDAYVDLLNQDLIMIEEALSTVLPLRRIRFIYDGLTHLISYTLCTNLRYIKRINNFGIMKLIRNVQSLQQCLTNIVAVNEKGLSRVKEYFELLKLSGESLMAHMETHPGLFNFEEYEVVLDLIFAEALMDESGVAKKRREDCLRRLKAHFIAH